MIQPLNAVGRHTTMSLADSLVLLLYSFFYIIILYLLMLAFLILVPHSRVHWDRWSVRTTLELWGVFACKLCPSKTATFFMIDYEHRDACIMIDLYAFEMLAVWHFLLSGQLPSEYGIGSSYLIDSWCYCIFHSTMALLAQALRHVYSYANFLCPKCLHSWIKKLRSTSINFFVLFLSY